MITEGCRLFVSLKNPVKDVSQPDSSETDLSQVDQALFGVKTIHLSRIPNGTTILD
jgi:hypothetical protein